MLVLSLILIAVLTFIDQIIKFAVVKNIPLYEVCEIIKIGNHKIFSLTHIKNDGAAWSIMAGKSWFLIGLPIVIIVIGLLYLYKRRNGSKIEIISLVLLISGGIGNLIDRIRFHEVIDYIKFEPINFPVFNFADICVVVGGIMFCIYFIIIDEIKKKRNISEKINEKN